MTVRCKQCSSELTDFSAPCPGCGGALNDKTIEIVDESGQPTPADFQATRSEVFYLFLAISGIALIAAVCTVFLYLDLVQWEQEGGKRRLWIPVLLAYRIGGVWGATAIPAVAALLVGAKAVQLALELPTSPSDTKAGR